MKIKSPKNHPSFINQTPKIILSPRKNNPSLGDQSPNLDIKQKKTNPSLVIQYQSIDKKQKKINPATVNWSPNINLKRTIPKKRIISDFQIQLKSSSLLRKSQMIKNKKEPKKSIVSNINNILKENTLFNKQNNKNKIKTNKKYLTKKYLAKKSKIINITYFYLIRKEIYKNFKKKYTSPYMEHLIKKGYFKNKEKEDYPLYYNYYQIYNLMNKKKSQLYAKYIDFLLTQDNQEYLLKYLENNEQYIIMNYLLYFVYNNDRCVIADNPKKLLKNEQIRAMFNKLVENNYLFDGTMEVLDDIGVYFRMSFSNVGKKVVFLEKLKPVIKNKIYYLYIKDIPNNLLPNIIPNIFPILKNNMKYKYRYLCIYLNKIKYNRIKKYQLYEEIKNTKDFELNNKDNIAKKNDFMINSDRSKSSSESNKENNIMLNNIYLSSNEEDKKDNFITMEKNNDRLNNIKNRNHDVIDIELFIDKFSPKEDENNYIQRKPIKKPTILENNINFIHNIRKQSSFYNSIFKNKKNLDSVHNNYNYNDENSLIENKNNIIMNNKKLFKKISKKEIFQTSLKGKNGICKNRRNKLSSTGAISSQFTKNSDNISYTYKYMSSKNLKLKKQNKNLFLRKEKSDLTQSNIINNNKYEIHKKKTYQEQKLTNKNKYELNSLQSKNSKNYFEFSSDENSEHSSNNNQVNINQINDNQLNKNYKKSRNKYNNNFLIKHISNNYVPIKNKNKFMKLYNFFLGEKIKYKIKKFPSLQEFENIYEKTKEMGMLPKNKMFLKGNKYRAFSDFSTNNFLIKVNNNKDIWEENKIDDYRLKSEYFYTILKKKINEENKKNERLSKNFCTLKQIVKCPNLYY